MKQLAKSGDLAVDLAAAFDASPNPYVLLRPDLRIAGANQAYLDVTGSARDAIIGQPIFAAFDSGSGDDAPENVRRVRLSLEKARDSRQRDHLALVRFSIPRSINGGEPIMTLLMLIGIYVPKQIRLQDICRHKIYKQHVGAVANMAWISLICQFGHDSAGYQTRVSSRCVKS